MNATPYYPKFLPWLARKAGISLHRAEVLWRAAQRHAAHGVGAIDTSAYWQAAMDRLFELVAAESLRADDASFGWRPWARHVRRYWQASLRVCDALSLNGMRSWQLLRPLRPG